MVTLYINNAIKKQADPKYYKFNWKDLDKNKNQNNLNI